MRFIFLTLLIISTQVFAQDSVPLTEYSGGHWGINVVVNGTTTYPFIIDTGAQGAIFPSRLVKELGGNIEELPEMVVQGAVGEKKLKRFSVKSMSIAGQSVSDIEGVVLDLPFKAADYNMPGVLPYTFLNQFMPKFDLANKRFTLLPKNGIQSLTEGDAENYSAIPFEFKFGSFISLELEVNNQKLAATLDSGAGNRIDVNWHAANAMGIDPENHNLTAGDAISGAGGDSIETLDYPDATVAINQIPLR